MPEVLVTDPLRENYETSGAVVRITLYMDNSKRESKKDSKTKVEIPLLSS
jgi:hypothetical protein